MECGLQPRAAYNRVNTVLSSSQTPKLSKRVGGSTDGTCWIWWKKLSFPLQQNFDAFSTTRWNSSCNL